MDFSEVGGVIDAEYEKPGEVVRVGTTLDLDIVRPKFDDYRKEAQRIATDVKALTVQDQESLNTAVSLGGRAKKIGKKIDADRKKAIEVPSEFVKGVNSICKAITDALDQAEVTVKEKIRIHNARIELERREAERKAREATEALQRKLDEEAAAANKKAADEAKAKAEEEAKAKGASPEEVKAEVARAEESAARIAVVAPTVVDPVVAEASRVTRTESGSAFSKNPWVFAVTDSGLVPREYLSVDMAKIRDAVRMGTREIVGVTIYQETQINFRA